MPTYPADSEETQRLLQQVRDGEAGALDRLFARHRSYLHRMIDLRLDPALRPRVDPSDVVQEAHLEANRRIGGYLEQPPLSFRLWLRQIAYDRLLMLRRRHLGAARRTVEREVALPDQSSLVLARQLLAADASPLEETVQRELAERVRNAMLALAESDREILLLRNYEGLSNQEVAQVLQLTASNASQRYGRALLRLRQLLLDSGLGESHA